MTEAEFSELRALAALAWADGAVTPEEAAALDRIAETMSPTPAQREEMARLLSEPVPLDRFEEAIRKLRATHGERRDLELLLRRARQVADADRDRAPEEERRLKALRALLEPEPAGGVLAARVRGLLGIAGRQAKRTGELVSAPVRALLDDAGLARQPAGSRLSEEEHVRLVLFGLLLDRVARADGVVQAAESEHIRRALEAEAGLSGEALERVLGAVGRHAVTEADRQRLCAEFKRRSGEEDRRRLLGALFAAAAADGEVSRAEETEIRLISNYLWIDPQDYHEIRQERIGGNG